jgi:hypothetical protein
MAKTAKQALKTGKPRTKTPKNTAQTEVQPPNAEQLVSKRQNDHDIFMRGLFEILAFAHKILNYAVFSNR